MFEEKKPHWLRQMGARVLVAAALLAICGAARGAGAETLGITLGESGQNHATLRPLTLGFGAFVGSAPRGEDGHDLLVPTELRVGYTVSRHVAFGIDQLSFACADVASGNRWAITAAPFVEAFTFLGERVQPYAQLGLATQWRFGADLDHRFGLAPTLAAGARYWFAGWFALGAEARSQLVVSDAFLLQERVLPNGAIPTTFGLTADFRI